MDWNLSRERNLSWKSVSSVSFCSLDFCPQAFRNLKRFCDLHESSCGEFASLVDHNSRYLSLEINDVPNETNRLFVLGGKCAGAVHQSSSIESFDFRLVICIWTLQSLAVIQSLTIIQSLYQSDGLSLRVYDQNYHLNHLTDRLTDRTATIRKWSARLMRNGNTLKGAPGNGHKSSNGSLEVCWKC